jgi:uncharacterized protein YecT (DUF1311 family)
MSNAQAAYVKADKELNEVYKQLRTMHKSDAMFIKNLKNAQRSWLKFRNAEFKMNFPGNNGLYDIRTLTDAQAEYLTNFTEERTKEFRVMLDPILDGLVAYYPFQGNANDVSGNRNNGINHGAILTNDRFGHKKSAYRFTGSSSITIPELFSADCRAFTFVAWVRKRTSDQANHMVIYKGTIQGEATMNITDGRIGCGVNLHEPGTLVSTQNWYSAVTTDTLRPNVDYFLVGRYSKGQKLELFINGILAASINVPELDMVADPSGVYSAIGTHGHPSIAPEYYWDGDIDDIRVYTKAIPDSIVQILYHEGFGTGK